MGGGNSNVTPSGKRMLEKSNRTYRKRIREHRGYLNNPLVKYKNWHDFSEKRKSAELRHWRTEINTFKKNIAKNNERLRRHYGRD